MEEHGISEREILGALIRAREKDMKYESGKILSSMCTLPHPFSKKVYKLFMETNLGDAGLFKGTKELEREAVRMLGSLLGNKNAAGFIISGGTEANIMAMWAARNKYKNKKKKPEVLLPETAHFSFEKACNLLGLKLRNVKTKKDHSIDVSDLEKNITGDTIAIVGVAGNTEYGAVDDIEALAKIALKNDLYFHVDAAFGGFVIPFLHTPFKFDFSVKGVSSITIDPHKMGLAPVPSGCVLFRDRSFLRYIETSSPYLTESKQFTLLGTRSGVPAAATYAVLKLLGKQGYKRNVKRCMHLTMKLYNELRGIGLDVLKPVLNIAVFSHKKQNLIAKQLLRRGWSVSRTKKGEIRLVIMPHVKEENINALVKDLREILNEFRNRAHSRDYKKE